MSCAELPANFFEPRESGNNTVQPTILVHDVFMKLSSKTDIQWENRAHFYAVAAKATRDLLVDHARRRGAARRGGGWNRLTLSGVPNSDQPDQQLDIMDLEEALCELGQNSPRQEKIVELRYFGGLSVEEVAQLLGISVRTVMYDWRMARAWLRTRLSG